MPSTLPIRVLRGLRAAGLERLASSRPADIVWPGGAVSFTFDDFPRSALTAGGRILEEYGLRGTYYASLQLAGSVGDLGPMFEREDVLAAHALGPELACHTYN